MLTPPELMNGGSAPLDPHLLVALPEAASSLASGNACPESRMDTAFTGMPVESETRPIPLVALALALGHPVGHLVAAVHALRAAWILPLQACLWKVRPDPSLLWP